MAQGKSLMKVANLGQVFTPPAVVAAMLALRQNTGRVLEPSCGDGAFSNEIADCVALELDGDHAPSYAHQLDFFEFPLSERFDSIIGNPPYVRHQDILPSTKALLPNGAGLFDGRSNLYLYFIEKCIRHLNDDGELIFIVPRDFIKATSAARLNQFIFDTGTITHFIEMGDQRIWEGATPNTVIFRFQKGLFDRKLPDGRRFTLQRGQLSFVRETIGGTLGDFFSVKVGAVSGADRLFENPEGNQEFVCSKTIDTGETRRMIYNQHSELLLPHKAHLLSRGIRRFNETTWWQWGRGYFESDLPRVYVNAKTRRAQPFFQHPATAYDGSILALFPRQPAIDLAAAVAVLNELPWAELGFVCDGRFLFSQRSLEGAALPVSAVEDLKKIEQLAN